MSKGMCLKCRVYWGIPVLLLLLLFSNTVNAGEKKGEAGQVYDSAIRLGEIVVTATRTKKTKDLAPASVSVLTRQEMEKQHIETIDEALKHEVGVHVARFGGILDSTPNVSMRGLPGDDRTLVLLNGLPLNQGYSGGVDWATLSLENVERIEVIRGASSALYGGNAMGGVINIITHSPKEFEGKIKAGYGSEETKRGSLYLGDRFWDRLSLSGGYEIEDIDDADPTDLVTADIDGDSGNLKGGCPATNPEGETWWVVGKSGDKQAQRWNANFRAVYDLPGTGKLYFDLQSGSRDYEYEEPSTYLKDAQGNPAYAGAVDLSSGQYTEEIDPSDYLSGIGETDFTNYALRYQDFWGELALDAKVGYQDRDKWYTGADQGYYQNATGSLSDSETQTYFADIQANYPLGERHLLTLGGYFRNDDFDKDKYTLSYYRSEHSKTGKIGLTKGEDRFYAAYIQDEWDILDELAIYAGLRFDYWEASDGKWADFENNMSKDYGDTNDNCLSPSLSANWHPLSDTYIKGSIAKGFRAPNIYELYSTWAWGGWMVYHSNPDLKPETLWNYELGGDQYFFDRRLKLSGTVFHTDVDDYIDTYKGEGPNYYDYYKGNIAEVEINGLEMAVSARPFDWLKVWANYTLNDAEYKECDKKPEIEGNNVVDVPDRMANVGTELSYKWLTTSLSGRYLGRIYSTEENSHVADVYTEDTSDFWLWDAKVTLSPWKHCDFSFAVKNLFDKEYYKYYIGRDRSYFCEVSLKW